MLEWPPGSTDTLSDQPDPAVDPLPPRLLVIQHGERTGLGPVREMRLDIDVHRADRIPEVPRLGSAAGVLILGGPQSPDSDDRFPGRHSEFRLIRECLDARVPLLGVCLGAQLLAIEAGGSCREMDEMEIGWWPVNLTEAGAQDRLVGEFAPSFVARHFHRYTFHTPPAAVRLAYSDHTEEQGFRIGDNVWGLQFHFWMTKFHRRLRAERGDVEMPEDGLANDPDLGPAREMLSIGEKILDNFARVVLER